MKIYELIQDKELIPSIGAGISKAREYFRSFNSTEEILSQYPGKFHRNTFYQACVEHFLAKELHNIPGLKIKEESNGYGYTFLQIESERFVMTVSRVPSEKVVPRNAKYRENRALSNQLLLFPEMEIQNKLPYMILIHGYVQNDIEGFKCFGGIGIPHPDYSDSWMEYLSINNSIKILELAPEEKVDAEQRIMLRIQNIKNERYGS
jgi:hypothetical protein